MRLPKRGAVCGMAAGMLMALPSLRVQGYYLGFVTMAAAIALPELLVLFKDQTHELFGKLEEEQGNREVRSYFLTLRLGRGRGAKQGDQVLRESGAGQDHEVPECRLYFLKMNLFRRERRRRASF